MTSAFAGLLSKARQALGDDPLRLKGLIGLQPRPSVANAGEGARMPRPGPLQSLWLRIGRVGERLSANWRGYSLSRQFAIASAVVIVLAMSAIGTWVANKIEEGVTSTTGAAAALYMDAFIAPLAQEIVAEGRITPANKAKLDEIMSHKDIRENVASIKIWLRDNTIVYSNIAEHIGRQYLPTAHLTKAWRGVVSAELDGASHEDDHYERLFGTPMLEIYAPIREAGSNHIVAVSEFYMRADTLFEALRKARLQSWAVVGATGGLLMLTLYAIVRRGSRTIVQQQKSLVASARQNADLRHRIERAYWRADRLNEQFLRRVGADLHDGPAQLLGLALLRLDDLPLDQARIEAEGSDSTHNVIRKALEDAIKEVRNLSRGLMLPELDQMSLNETALLIAHMHQERTGSVVELDLPADPIDPPKAYKICAYRFMQEALSNAYRHAGGVGQRVVISCHLGHLQISVSDNGPGLKTAPCATAAAKLGLAGIRDRVETLAGQFEIIVPPEGGTTLRVTLDTSKQLSIED